MPKNTDKTLSDTPPATSGLMTTEFWKSFIYAGVSLLTGVGVISPSVPDKYKTVIDSAAFVMGGLVIIGYAISRGITKAAAIKATAEVKATAIANLPSAQVAKLVSPEQAPKA